MINDRQNIYGPEAVEMGYERENGGQKCLDSSGE